MNMTRANQEKFFNNVLKFTAPALAVFFGQLATGVNWRAAGAVALLALWGLASDYFSKMK